MSKTNMFEDAHEIVSDGITEIKSQPRHVKFWRTILLLLMVGFAFTFPIAFWIVQGVGVVITFVCIVEELFDDDTWWLFSYGVLAWIAIVFIGTCASIWVVWTWMSPTANKGKKNIGGVVHKFNKWVDEFKIIRKEK